MTIGDALRQAAARIGPMAWARDDAETLMAHAVGVSRSTLLLHHLRDPAPPGFAPLLQRRLNHEPVAYILGSAEFFGLPLTVSPAVLIPRGDSEVVVRAALAARPDAVRVLDCGTGSGALLLAVLNASPQAQGVGIDRSAPALAVAEGNADRLGLHDRAAFVLADWERTGWTDRLGGPFDLIVANPPYVEDSAALDPAVRDYEPAGALFAGTDGLDAYRLLIPQLPSLLAPHGVAIVEIGSDQAEAVSALGASAGMTGTLHRDLAGRPRALEFKFLLGNTVSNP